MIWTVVILLLISGVSMILYTKPKRAFAKPKTLEKSHSKVIKLYPHEEQLAKIGGIRE
jgi:hypothetical protein